MLFSLTEQDIAIEIGKVLFLIPEFLIFLYRAYQDTASLEDSFEKLHSDGPKDDQSETKEQQDVEHRRQ